MKKLCRQTGKIKYSSHESALKKGGKILAWDARTGHQLSNAPDSLAQGAQDPAARDQPAGRPRTVTLLTGDQVLGHGDRAERAEQDRRRCVDARGADPADGVEGAQ